MADKIAMQTFHARLESFKVSHQLSKRRASSQAGKKKGANTLHWPHKLPESKDLARAGFYFQPSPESPDNVQCFFCDVKLDGWEESDVPVQEHLAHSSDCKYAQCLNAALEANKLVEAGQLDNLGELHPMTDELVAARRATFEIGTKWPHESKKGWKCKVAKMVNAGWCFDPFPSTVEDEELDHVTCFYCGTELGEWERQDDPAAEHRQRRGDCAFFQILDRSAATGKSRKAGGKAARGSTTSKASRISTQSAMSTFSEQPSFADSQTLDDLAEPDDSIMTAGTTASQATVTGKTAGRKGGKAKATTKTGKGRSRAGTVDSQAEPESLYPDLSQSQALSQPSMPQADVDEEPGPPAKRSRKGTRQSKQTGSQAIDVVPTIEAPAQKPTRGRKAKAASQIRSQPDTEEEPLNPLDQSVASAQLQEELDRSLSIDLDARFELDDRNAQPAPNIEKPTRGTKRTSDGLQKPLPDLQGDRDSSVMLVEFPVPPAAKAAPKTKKGRKASKQVKPADNLEKEEQAVSQSEHIEGGHETTQPDSESVDPMQIDKAPPKPKVTGRKASSNKSRKASKASSTTEPALIFEQRGQEDLEQDEREIEAELDRIAAEQAKDTNLQAVAVDTDKVDEFEPSPSSVVKKTQQLMDQEHHVDAIQHLERELQAEVNQLPQPGTNLATYVKAVARSSSSTKSYPATDVAQDQTPSPSGSDKENAPSSAAVNNNNDGLSKNRAASPSPHAKSITHNSQSPVRIPLASTTPNRAPAPALKSPNKLLSHPTSTVPWEPKDLETLLLASPPHPLATLDYPSLSPSGATAAITAGGASDSFAARLAGAAGVLPSPEKKLTVEEWVRLQADKGDRELRRKCEELVARFEREGNRAMASLGGLVVDGAVGK